MIILLTGKGGGTGGEHRSERPSANERQRNFTLICIKMGRPIRPCRTLRDGLSDHRLKTTRERGYSMIGRTLMLINCIVSIAVRLAARIDTRSPSLQVPVG